MFASIESIDGLLGCNQKKPRLNPEPFRAEDCSPDTPYTPKPKPTPIKHS